MKWIAHCLTCWSDECLRASGYDAMFLQSLTLAGLAAVFLGVTIYVCMRSERP